MIELSQLEEILRSYPGFSEMEVRIKSMNPQKKDSFWATSIKRYLTNGHSSLNQEGTIYLNLKDIEDDEKLIEAVAHEASHLLDDEVLPKVIIEFIKEKLQ